MMVTFVSQCEKKALKRTRRVLDAFADRIGDNTWQTVITKEGLQAVRKLLRKTASKNTAVSCHWIRSRSRTELVWVVGQKHKFNGQGIVPVNLTETAVEMYLDKSSWSSLSLIRYAATIAALFHDFGKANLLFQNKINPKIKTDSFEPYRHEWISLRLFEAFVGKKSDLEWLEAMTEIDRESIGECYKDGVQDGSHGLTNPLLSLPPFARFVGWLIVSHHRLPAAPRLSDGSQMTASLDAVDTWMEINFEARWNSNRCRDSDQISRLKDNWSFAALPYQSMKWRSRACTVAASACQALPTYLVSNQDFINDQIFTSHLSRLVVMLADHYYSSQLEPTPEWQSKNYSVYANSYTKNEPAQGFKQQLDEHLIGVAHYAEKISKALPRLNKSLASLDDNEFLTSPVHKAFKDDFGWQDTAKKMVGRIAGNAHQCGFFGINMASTGKGKTLANAKIMAALGEQTGRTRFSVAIGLRTLTLQTGKEFREKLKLDSDQMAIAVGGAAVKQLFEHAQSVDQQNDMEAFSGSESDQPLIESELYVDYAGETNHSLSEWTSQDKRIDQLLCAPVLVSTIDHLVPATEGTRGGKQIAPMLRLLTADLVLDEPDDFGLDDLPALCRLVHWAGMLGSNVLLSTATISPVLAFALFDAYRSGRLEFAKSNLEGWDGKVCCAWFDEFGVSSSENCFAESLEKYKGLHQSFVEKRIKHLSEVNRVERFGEIATLTEIAGKSIQELVADTIYDRILALHKRHHITNGGRKISIGLVRMANINPLVSVMRELIKKAVPTQEDSCIHYCVYHSRYPLAIRSYLESRLDRILKRKDEGHLWQPDGEIGRVLAMHPETNHVFVVLASPVAEVGRDHDYDWAIVEPSSLRSIVQLAGRVLRHRHLTPTSPNVVLLNKNVRALQNKKVCFEKPGFESNGCRVASHELENCLPKEHFVPITAIPKIEMPNMDEWKPVAADVYSTLNALEHRALALRLFQGRESGKIWWRNHPHWCGEVQRQQRFRKSKDNDAYYLCVDDAYKTPYFIWLNEDTHPPRRSEVSKIQIDFLPEELAQGENVYFWFDLDPFKIYSRLAKELGLDLPEVSSRFGELRVTDFGSNRVNEYRYHKNLGLFQEVNQE
jgi:CRISPR-associated endonuclease/helicase Cas3